MWTPGIVAIIMETANGDPNNDPSSADESAASSTCRMQRFWWNTALWRTAWTRPTCCALDRFVSSRSVTSVTFRAPWSQGTFRCVVFLLRTPAQWWSGASLPERSPSPGSCWRHSRATRPSGTWWTPSPSRRSTTPTDSVSPETSCQLTDGGKATECSWT